MQVNLAWVEPKNIATALQEAYDQLQHLAAARPDMPLLVNQHLENLKAAIQFLEEYTAACQQQGGQQSPAVTPAAAASPVFAIVDGGLVRG